MSETETEIMLTTIDNPHDPFEDYDLWYAYDTLHGHHTMSFLARIVVTSDELSESDQKEAIDSAIEEAVRENVSGMYRKVSREVEVVKD